MKTQLFLSRLQLVYFSLYLILSFSFLPFKLHAQPPTLTIQREEILYHDQPTKLIGLRCSNALISDQTTQDLIDHLDEYTSYGINTISVFMMGSRFGDVKGYLPNGNLNPRIKKRMKDLLQATEAKGMIMIVGCLYWGTSLAKEDLYTWTQHDAEKAITNTARWLKKQKFTHIILDPDNEGMAVSQNDWQIEGLITAAKMAYPDLLVANNTKQDPPNEDLNMHFGKKEAGKPWLDSESTPKTFLKEGYWGTFSKETHQSDSSFYNYSRIGRYTDEMKKHQLLLTQEGIEKYNGIILASTWIQCGPHENIGGPFTKLGGYSEVGSSMDVYSSWNKEIDTLHPDAGILWWMEYIRETYGP